MTELLLLTSPVAVLIVALFIMVCNRQADEEARRRIARRQDGRVINAKDVQGELVDLRGMDGDVKSIRWADGTMGLNGADLTIVCA